MKIDINKNKNKTMILTSSRSVGSYEGRVGQLLFVKYRWGDSESHLKPAGEQIRLIAKHRRTEFH